MADASSTDLLYGRRVREIEGGAPIETPPCQACGGASARPRFEVEGLDSPIVVCEGCGLGSYHPMPSPEAIAGFYPDHYYGEEGAKFEPVVEALVRAVGARHARFWTRGLPEAGRILDLGCGRGVLLRAFLDQGFESHGMETSAAAVRGIDPRAEVRIAADLRQCEYPESHFDQVVIWHVLEHLADPGGVLEECRRILRPGGRVVVAVPNFSSLQARWAGAAWFHLDPPRHLFHFPVGSLRSMLESRGFECLSEHHFSLRQNPYGWVQSFLNRSDGVPRNALYTLLQPQSGARSRLARAEQRRQRLAYLVGMPLGLVASLWTTLRRSGATVTVVARARRGHPGAP